MVAVFLSLYLTRVAREHTALGLGDFEWFEYAHPRRVAREIIFERTLVDLNLASARQHADACDCGFAPAGRADDVLFLWHRPGMSSYVLQSPRSDLHWRRFLCRVRMFGAAVDLE